EGHILLAIVVASRHIELFLTLWFDHSYGGFLTGNAVSAAVTVSVAWLQSNLATRCVDWSRRILSCQSIDRDTSRRSGRLRSAQSGSGRTAGSAGARAHSCWLGHSANRASRQRR
ncbi:unnamed protein product, partial [Mycena citricolor]